MRDEGKNKLRESLRGAIIERGDGDYDDARALYNAVSSKDIEQGNSSRTQFCQWEVKKGLSDTIAIVNHKNPLVVRSRPLRQFQNRFSDDRGVQPVCLLHNTDVVAPDADVYQVHGIPRVQVSETVGRSRIQERRGRLKPRAGEIETAP